MIYCSACEERGGTEIHPDPRRARRCFSFSVVSPPTYERAHYLKAEEGRRRRGGEEEEEEERGVWAGKWRGRSADRQKLVPQKKSAG